MSTEAQGNRAIGLIGVVAAYLVLTTWAVLSLVPVYWMFVTAFETQENIISVPPHWFPSPITFENFELLFTNSYMPRWFFNSLFVSSVTTIGEVIFCTMAGYAFAKLRFPGRIIIFWILLSMLMVPGIVTLIPLFIFAGDVGWLDTYAILIVPGLSSIWGIFLVKQFIQTLPSTLIDAARIDACSEFGVYRKVILPLSKPAVAVLGIFYFIGSWNDFFWWLLMTSSLDMRNLPVGLSFYRHQVGIEGGGSGGSLWGGLLAGAVVAALPVIIIFFAFQRYFMRGLTIGALKG
jgi:multiple sugar transport system permease protein